MDKPGPFVSPDSAPGGAGGQPAILLWRWGGRWVASRLRKGGLGYWQCRIHADYQTRNIRNRNERSKINPGNKVGGGGGGGGACRGGGCGLFAVIQWGWRQNGRDLKFSPFSSGILDASAWLWPASCQASVKQWCVLILFKGTSRSMYSTVIFRNSWLFMSILSYSIIIQQTLNHMGMGQYL